MEERIFDKINLNNRTISSDGEMEVQYIDGDELFKKLFFYVFQGQIGVYNLANALSEENLKKLEEQVQNDIDNGLLPSETEEYDLEL